MLNGMGLDKVDSEGNLLFTQGKIEKKLLIEKEIVRARMPEKGKIIRSSGDSIPSLEIEKKIVQPIKKSLSQTNKETPLKADLKTEEMSITLNRQEFDVVAKEEDISKFLKEIENFLQKPASSFTLNEKSNFLVRLAFLGKRKDLHDQLHRIIKKLRVDGDSTHYNIKISLNPAPNASIKGNDITITAGLLYTVKNEDELASVIAHEMTHGNLKMLKAMEDSPGISRALDSLESYKGLDASMQEEMRADVGALYRMMKGGYNPWAAYDLEQRFGELDHYLFGKSWTRSLNRMLFKRRFIFRSTHPHTSIRKQIVKIFVDTAKTYIDENGVKKNVSTLVSKTKTPLTGALKRGKTITSFYAPLFVSKWASRAMKGVITAQALILGRILFPELYNVSIGAIDIGSAVDSLGDGAMWVREKTVGRIPFPSSSYQSMDYIIKGLLGISSTLLGGVIAWPFWDYSSHAREFYWEAKSLRKAANFLLKTLGSKSEAERSHLLIDAFESLHRASYAMERSQDLKTRLNHHLLKQVGWVPAKADLKWS